MTGAIDPVQLATASDGPSLLGATLRIVLMLAVIVAAGWGWLYWQRRARGPERRLQVLDRAFLMRGAGVALLRADDRRLLVGVSAEGVRLLRDLDAGSGHGGGDRQRRRGTQPFPRLLDEIRREGEDP